MDYSEFVKSTVCSLGEDCYTALRRSLVGEYLSFSIISDAEITKKILAEKICDYFEKLELKTGKSFEKYINVYMDNGKVDDFYRNLAKGSLRVVKVCD